MRIRRARADLVSCACLCFCAALQQDSSAEAFQAIGDWDLYFDRCELMRLLNEEGTYTAAVQQGLHANLLACWSAEAERVDADPDGKGVSRLLRWWRKGWPASDLHATETVILRAQRRSRAGHPGFTKMDGGRCADLIRSDADAWPTWLRATLAQGEVSADPVVKAQGGHPRAHRNAR